jgi:hypothetical protein
MFSEFCYVNSVQIDDLEQQKKDSLRGLFMDSKLEHVKFRSAKGVTTKMVCAGYFGHAKSNF